MGKATAKTMEPQVQEVRKEFLSVRELCEVLSISEGMAYRLLQSGRIPHTRIHGLYRIHRPTMIRALVSGTPGNGNPDES